MESKRLYFREISFDDTELIVKWRSDYETYRYFISPHKITVEEHINWYNQKYLTDKNRLDFLAIIKETDEPIGVFGLIYVDATVEVNYLLGKEFRGNGYAIEAVEYLIRYAKEERKIKKAIAEVHKDNNPSLSLVNRLDFTEVGRDGSIIVFEKNL